MYQPGSEKRGIAGSFGLGLHSGLLICFFLILGLFALVLTNPAYLLVLFLGLLIGMISRGAKRQLLSALRISLYIGSMILLINLLVSRSGQTVIFESQSLPLYGRMLITLETIMFSLSMWLKLTVIILLFFYYGSVLSPDRSFAFLSRFAPQSALLIILSTLLVPRLKRRLEEAHLAMCARGLALPEHGLKSRVAAYKPLIKVLLLSSLEDSWHTAEALQARAFGTGPRSYYNREYWGVGEIVFLFFVSVIAVVLGISIFAGNPRTSFYPVFDFSFSEWDLVLCLPLFVSLLSLPLIDRLLYGRSE